MFGANTFEKMPEFCFSFTFFAAPGWLPSPISPTPSLLNSSLLPDTVRCSRSILHFFSAPALKSTTSTGVLVPLIREWCLETKNWTGGNWFWYMFINYFFSLSFNIFLFRVSWSFLFICCTWPCPISGDTHNPQPTPQFEENQTYTPRKERMWECYAHFKMQEKHLLEGWIGRLHGGKGSL